MPRQQTLSSAGWLLALCIGLPAAVAAGEWTNWRGPHHNGVSPEASLVDSWSQQGENLIWRDDFTGRSTPVVLDGRVCAIGRVGEGIERQEMVACWDAESGRRLWEKRFNVYQTAVPWNRVGWASLAADSETGYIFVHTVDGRLYAFDKAGNTIWQWHLAEELGRLSGYGGRTHTPIVDENRVILGAISSNWGEHGRPSHRYFAFDKTDGKILWVSAPAGPPSGDLNTQSTPVIAIIKGQRLLIGGNADGKVYALQARTGKPVWSFHLSKRGINASVAVSGHTVFASHSEENLDTGTMGRVVAIDGRGKGDITQTHELWRADEVQSGFPSPVVHGKRLYLADNSANLRAFDIATGNQIWEHNYGTVGKAPPTWADGKMYLTEVNGNVSIIRDTGEEAELLDKEHLEMPDGRYAEIYGSFAVADGRLYFTTEEGIYCLGKKGAGGAPAKAEPMTGEAATGPIAQILVVPGEVVLKSGQEQQFEVHAFDAGGRFLKRLEKAQWSTKGLAGEIDDQGKASFDGKASQVGLVQAQAGAYTATARVRLVNPLPWSFDFESLAVEDTPASWRPRHKPVRVAEMDGGKVLRVPKAPRGAPRAFMYLGTSDMAGYTVQADVKGTREGRRLSDVGVINSGYNLNLLGAHQRLQVSSWTSERRMMQQVDFSWEIDTWYTMKLRVDFESNGKGGEKAVIRGKVWKRTGEEPAGWSITVEDPLPIKNGSPGIYTFAPVPSYFDNVKVMVSK